MRKSWVDLADKIRKIHLLRLKRLHLAERGFTLLEILLAFFIFSILFITIYTSYSGTFKTINLTENRMELYRKAAIALERISEDLQASYITILPPDSLEEPSVNTRFLGEDNNMNGEEADSLNFFSIVAPLFSKEAEAATTGLFISYSVIQGREEEELMLLRSEQSEFIAETEEREGMVLSDGLKAVNFIFYDDDGNTHDQWDSDSEEFKGSLPRMVTVELEFVNYENPEAPLKVMTSVAMQVY
jgi:prepilin-type N-terminal cleavage/methylation domain-containing protein